MQNGRTPLHLANAEVATVLLNAKADIHAKGWVSVYTVVVGGVCACVSQCDFLWMRAPTALPPRLVINVPSRPSRSLVYVQSSCTPLHRAETAEVAKVLLNAKADIHAEHNVSVCVSQCEWLWMRAFGTGER